MTPTLSKGFYLGCDDIVATKRFPVYPGAECFPVATDVMALPLVDLMNELQHGDVNSQ